MGERGDGWGFGGQAGSAPLPAPASEGGAEPWGPSAPAGEQEVRRSGDLVVPPRSACPQKFSLPPDSWCHAVDAEGRRRAGKPRTWAARRLSKRA